jgi:hypothetical protein
MPKTRGSHRADERQRRNSQCAFSPGKLIPNKFPFRGLSFPVTLAGSLGPTLGPPLLSRLTFRSPLYIVCASFSPGLPQNLSPEFLPCPRPLLALLSVTPSRARASAPGPGSRCTRRCPERALLACILPFSLALNRSPPCGRCRVASSTVLRKMPGDQRPTIAIAMAHLNQYAPDPLHPNQTLRIAPRFRTYPFWKGLGMQCKNVVLGSHRMTLTKMKKLPLNPIGVFSSILTTFSQTAKRPRHLAFGGHARCC